MVLGHRARTTPDFPLNDLCGAAGRWDGLARCINTGLLLSHEIRDDTSIHLILLGEEDPPKVLTVCGERVRYLNPDERSTAALMKKALEVPLSGSLRRPLSPSPGLFVSRGTLEEFLEGIVGRVYLLDEGGSDLHSEGIGHVEGELFFFLSDDMDLTGEERSLILSRADGSLSVGPRVLQAHQVIAVVNNVLDRTLSR